MIPSDPVAAATLRPAETSLVPLGQPSRPTGHPAIAALLEVKSLGGSNFIRPDRVIAIQTSPTGTSVIVMEGGASVHSSETTKAIAARIEAADKDR
jgi:hypothetical protein